MRHGSIKITYEDRIYARLKRQGWAAQFEHPGIYKISIDDQIVYIGKSKNMLRRLAQHQIGIEKQEERKYRILAEAKRHRHKVSFDVLYYAVELTPTLIEEELGEKEGEFIRANMPVLNKQIPKTDNWRSYEINEIANTITLSEILQQQKKQIQMEQI